MVQTQLTPQCIGGAVVMHIIAVVLHKLRSAECLSQLNLRLGFPAHS